MPFKPGESGNPEGRPVNSGRSVADVMKLARKRLTKPAINVLESCMKDPNAAWNARVRAAEVSLSWAWDKPAGISDMLKNASENDLERLATQVLELRRAAAERKATEASLS